MTLPTLTRGVFWRDDFLTVTWGADTSVIASTNGDILSLSGTDATHIFATGQFSTFSTTTYPFLAVRAKGNGTIDVKVYTNSGNQTFTLSLTSNYTVFVLALITGRTLDTIQIFNQSVPGTNNFDFVQFFKETLTLPSVTRPIRMRKQRYLNKMQILQREGNIVQDLGSSSPEFDVSGSFITTSQYGADVWPQVLDGLILESSTVQADGNPTWQWFSSDLYQRKVLVMDAMVEDVPGRLRNTMNDYVLRLLQWDTIGETTGALGAVS